MSRVAGGIADLTPPPPTENSPIQPKWVPTNCRFEIDDVEREWTFNENLFDLIHCRNISQSISDWPKLLKNIYRYVFTYILLCDFSC